MTEPALTLMVALGVGLLLGVERERRKGRGPDRGAAGVRTFALVGLAGGLSWRIGGTVTAAVALGFVGLAAVAGYVRSHEDDPGITTEVALVVDFLLGALAQRNADLAAGLAVITAVVLAGRERIHALVRETLSERELHDALLFAACALVVLPLVPDKGLGPHGSLNPAIVWRLVVIVMAVQGAGYIALRAIGPRYGLLFAGLLGGFVSSIATVATMGARARAEPPLRRGAIAAAISSSIATVILLAIVVGATSVPTLEKLTVPLLLAGIAAVGYGAVFAVRAARGRPPKRLARGRAFDLRVALLLAAAVAVVLLVSSELNAGLGPTGVVLGTGVAGLADSQAAAISAAALVRDGHVSPADAALAILVVLTTNTLSKALAAAVLGRRRFALAVWPGLALILAGAWAGWALTQI